MKIMLVDSDKSALKVLESYISVFYRDSEIIEFSNPREALEFIESENHPADICYTAVMMPNVTGFRLADELKKKSKKNDVVFLSVSPEYAIDAWKYSVADYLMKPITYEKIEHAVGACAPRFIAV